MLNIVIIIYLFCLINYILYEINSMVLSFEKSSIKYLNNNNINRKLFNI